MAGGDATWHENQLVPIERNGRIEDVWWTYSYGPAFDDDGRVAGVLVVCQETTAHVLADRERERLLAETARAERRAARVLERVSDEHLTMDASFRIQSVNDAAQRALGLPREQLIGRTHWEAFPRPWVPSWTAVVIHGAPSACETALSHCGTGAGGPARRGDGDSPARVGRSLGRERKEEEPEPSCAG